MVPAGAPPIGASGARARAATWARASARTRRSRRPVRPRPGRGQNRRPFPWDPLRGRILRSTRRPPVRGGMSTPHSLRTSPHRLARGWRLRPFHAIGQSPNRNKKLWGDLRISLSISVVVQRFIHTCCTAPKALGPRLGRVPRRFASKSAWRQACAASLVPSRGWGRGMFAAQRRAVDSRAAAGPNSARQPSRPGTGAVARPQSAVSNCRRGPHSRRPPPQDRD